MHTMTIHADDVFADALRAYADRIGKSVNQTVQELLAPAIGLAKSLKKQENPFMQVCGVISKTDGKALMAACAEQRKIDPEMWR